MLLSDCAIVNNVWRKLGLYVSYSCCWSMERNQTNEFQGLVTSILLTSLKQTIFLGDTNICLIAYTKR